jgi:PAS domain S-box-containing protein
MTLTGLPEFGHIPNAAAHAGTGIAVLDLEGRILEVNAALCAMLGRTVEELTATTWQALTHPEDITSTAALEAELRAGRSHSYRAVKRYLRGDGEVITADQFTTAVRRPDGSLECLTCQIIDQSPHEVLRRHYQLIAENITDVVALGDEDNSVTWLSPSFTTVMGLEPQAWVGQSLLDHVDPADAANLARALARRDPDRVEELDVRLDTAFGGRRWMSLRIKVLASDDGAAWVATWWDSQHEHEMRHELITSEARFRAALDAEIDLHLFLEAVRDEQHVITDLVITDLNGSATEYLGRARAELLGRRASELPPLQAFRVLGDVYRTIDTGERLFLEDVSVPGTVDSTPRRFDVQAVRIGDGASLVLKDVTRRNNAVDALTASEQRYRMLTEHASDIVIQTSPDSTIDWVSPAVQVVLGKSPEEVVGRRLVELIHPDDRALAGAASSTMQDGQRSRARFRLARADGEWRWFDAAGSPIFGADGSVVARVGGLRDITDQVVASEQLAQAEAQFRLLAENSTDIVILTNFASSITWVSPSVEQVLGRRPAELVGTSIRALIHPDDLHLAPRVASTVDQGGTARLRVRFSTAEGSWLWFDSLVSPVMSADGAITGRVTGLREITDQVLATERLEKAEEQFRLLAENASDIVTLTSLDATIQWVSPSVEDVLGIAPHDMVGRKVVHTIHPDDEPAAAAFRATLERGEQARGQMRLATGDGSWRWFEALGRPVRDKDGQITSRVAGLRDITDQVLATRRLQEAEARYRMLAEHASDIVLQTDVRGIIEWVSPSSLEMLGYHPEQLVGTQVHELLHREDAPEPNTVRPVPTHSMRTRGRIRRADGVFRWMEATAQPVLAADGTVVGRIGGLRDIHEEVLASRALAESEQQALELARRYEFARDAAQDSDMAKTAFLSRMSHELRTPLNAVLGFAQLLEMDDLDDQQLDAVQHILTAGRHLLELIGEVLDISRIEAGRMSLLVEPVELIDALTEAVDLIRPTARNAEVTVTVAADCTAFVRADRQRFIQIVLNLLTNAVKYNRPGGTVTVACAPAPEGKLEVRVTDTGPGIPEHQLSKVFQPFERLGAESTAVQGTGIGLTLAQALAVAMDGYIAVDSVLGEGTTFTVVLPLAESASAPAQVTGGPAGPSVLYVEDNSANAALMQRIIMRVSDATLQVEADGASGLRAALAGGFDLILLDVHLPDMSGESVLRRLRAERATADTPVVVVTADAAPDLRHRLVGLGADDILTKPVDVQRLLEWLRDPHGRQEGRP